MDNTLPILGHGATESRTSIQDILAHQLFPVTATARSIANSFHISYGFPHLNQKAIGKCTAEDLCDMAKKKFGIEFSTDFTYWGGKSYDGNTYEGSSNVSMFAYSKNVGFLPASMDPGCNNSDGTYGDFLARKKSYTPEQIAAAKNYRLDQKNGYARVADMSADGLAAALQNSELGLIVMIQVGDNFYRPSWKKSDLELLRAPNPITSGHSIKIVGQEGTGPDMILTFRNTWGDQDNPTIGPGLPIWSDDGDIRFKYSTQIPYIREAYTVYFDKVTFNHRFEMPIGYGETSAEVTALQRVLQELGFFNLPAGVQYGHYGPVTAEAVLSFQRANAVSPSTIEALEGKVFGPATRAALNTAQGLQA